MVRKRKLEIPLSQGRVAVIDETDYILVEDYKYYFKDGYAVRNLGPTGRQRTIFMHNDIMGTPRRPLSVDHKDGDGLNNCRSNLRIASKELQMFNRMFPKRNLPRGVYKANSRYAARYRSGGRLVHIGMFNDPDEAHFAYREAVYKIYGEYPPER